MSSSGKRRKLEAPDTPQLSAVSALAARRRLQSALSSAGPDDTPASSSNPFSPLQAPRPERAKTPKKTAVGATGDRPRESPSAVPQTTYSSFLLTKDNYRRRGNGIAEIRLVDSERFLIVGSFGIRVLSGEIVVAGATLRPSDTHWIHAAHCHAIPVLRTAEKTRFEILEDPKADGLRRLGRLSPLFRGIWNELDAGKEASTYRFLASSKDAPRKCIIQELTSPPKWNKKLASLMESAGRPLTTLICGPKSAGKSTFTRLLANRFLTLPTAGGVVVLDLDPGQPEYAPPGTLSLVHVTKPNLGAPFTHPGVDDGQYRVLRCHSLASANPASATELHLECAMDLYEHYRRTHRHLPLLVNTPGWILGLGLQLLVQLISNIRPAEVVYMSEEGPMDTVEALMGATKDSFTTLPSQPAEFASRTAAHFRDMQFMSYFHAVFDPVGRLDWGATALSMRRPIAVCYAGRRRGILGILRYDYQLESNLLAEAINGMVLAIVEIESPEAFRGLVQAQMASIDSVAHQGGPATPTTPEGIPFIPNPNDIALDPRHSRTIGLALVRGIDTARRALNILTPTPTQRIADARAKGHDIVLVFGNFDAPTWAYTEHMFELEVDDDAGPAELEVKDDDTGDDSDDNDPSDGGDTAAPWVEALSGSQKRPVGSQVWRVRRDLGRTIE